MPENTALAPALLVALDALVDPNFARSVVLVLEHDAERGAFGLIVNRRTEVTLAQLCETQGIGWRGDPARRVDWGGPVGEDGGWVLLGDDVAGGAESVRLLDGVWWSRSRDALRLVGERPELPARVMLGYAGWTAGQLESEIAAGAWLVVPASARLVFETPQAECWTAAVRSIGVDPAMLVASTGVN